MNDRTSTETRTGIARIATTSEIDTATNDLVIVTPLKLKSRFDNTARISVNATDGLTQSGTIWSTVSVGIRLATEAQRGTLRVSTQLEANGSSSDDTVVTPKKLDGRKATRTLDGIIRVATTAEVRTGTAINLAVSPEDFKYIAQTEPTWSGNETRRGFVKTATVESTFVGNNTAGSTQAYTSYANDGLAVSPRGLNYALQNYLPLNATAQNALSLGGVVANDWVRRTVAQTVTGGMTFTAAMVAADITNATTTSARVIIDNTSTNSVQIGKTRAGGANGITILAGSDAAINDWAFIAGGVGGSEVAGDEIAIATKNGGTFSSKLKVNRNGDVRIAQHIKSTAGFLVMENSGARIYLGGTEVAANQFAQSVSGGFNFGNTSSTMAVLTSSDDAFTINGSPVINTANAQTKLNPTYLRRDGTSTMTGAMLLSNTGDNVKYLQFKNSNRYITSRGNDFIFGNTDTTNGRVCLDTNKNPIVKIGNFEYEIYHKGNKPTAQDVGAVDITGSSSNNITIRDWIKIGNVKIVANNLTKTVEFIWEE